MGNICTQENYIRIENLITSFCDIVLTKKDELDLENTKQFIEHLTKEDKIALNFDEPENDSTIRLIIQLRITKYLQSYGNFAASNSVKRPFEFDSGGKYKAFCENCDKYYKEQNSGAHLPSIISFTLKYIQEMSEHYRIFGCFYDIRSKETSYSILEDVAGVAEEKAKIAVQGATEESARKAVEIEIDKKMNDVTKNISETSVTILGIFAGIVLTVVAGLFYSSSVLDNINAANFCRLISISALVGFVCYSLIALMFRYIERLKYGKDETPRFNKLSIGISCVLLAITILFGIFQFFDSNDDKSAVISESVVDVNITTPNGETTDNEKQSGNEIEQNITSNNDELISKEDTN